MRRMHGMGGCDYAWEMQRWQRRQGEQTRFTIHPSIMPHCTKTGCSLQQSACASSVSVRMLQVIGVMTYSNSVLPRMPASMEDLLVEVQGFLGHILPQPSGAQTILCPKFIVWQWSANLLRFERRLICLQHDITERIHIKYPEIVMVRAR